MMTIQHERLSRQIPLQLSLHDEATFSNFYTGNNAFIVDRLQMLHTEQADRFIYLWSKPGNGRSHLLQACCHQASQLDLSSVYLTFLQKETLSPKIFEGLENISLICLDDIDQLAAKQDWQEALFHLYNRVRDLDSHLIVSGSVSPTHLPVFPDLASRLAWGVVYQLQELTDTDKIHALQLRAKNCGLKLSLEVGKFLLTRCSRDMKTLFTILDTLDKASLSAQRRLTIPFVKIVLSL